MSTPRNNVDLGLDDGLYRFEEIQRRLLAWYAENRRFLPWRDSSDPYAVLVSEIMLQQTGVERVRPIFQSFLDQFPTFEALATAPRLDVVRAWAGLGYNRRAVNLHECAKIVLRDLAGSLPRDPVLLRRLPGVGPYTVAAIQSFVFHEDVAAVDTNVRRVVGRVVLGPAAEPGDIVEIANTIVPHGQSAAWNQGLMDLGSSYCTSSSPDCPACPLEDVCASAATFRVNRPIRKVAERSAPYQGSRRFLRGRIVAFLREQEPDRLVSLAELAGELAVDRSDDGLVLIEDLARALATDGLARVLSVDGATYVGPPQ